MLPELLRTRGYTRAEVFRFLLASWFFPHTSGGIKNQLHQYMTF